MVNWVAGRFCRREGQLDIREGLAGPRMPALLPEGDLHCPGSQGRQPQPEAQPLWPLGFPVPPSVRTRGSLPEAVAHPGNSWLQLRMHLACRPSRRGVSTELPRGVGLQPLPAGRETRPRQRLGEGEGTEEDRLGGASVSEAVVGLYEDLNLTAREDASTFPTSHGRDKLGALGGFGRPPSGKVGTFLQHLRIPRDFPSNLCLTTKLCCLGDCERK